MRLNKTVQDHIENYVEMFDINGLAQIDYIIKFESLSSNKVLDYIKSF